MAVPESKEPPHGGALPIPATFSGSAAFARKSAAWLFGSWLLLALAATCTCLWLIAFRWLPIVETSMWGLPETMALEAGQLTGLPTETTLQHQNRFLSLEVTGSPAALGSMTGDIHLIFTPRETRLSSLIFQSSWSHPVDLKLDLNPVSLKPWWRARKPLFLGATFIVVGISLLATWIALATLYAIPLQIVAFFGDRASSFSQTWCLAGTALIPGAVIMTAAILLYGLHLLNLLGLLAAMVIHFLVGWIFAVGAMLKIPRLQARLVKSEKNPFAANEGPSNPFDPNPER